MRIEIENWWKQALADLKSSKNCISSGDFFLSVFISQQAVEKALKALLLLKLKELSRGHSIIYLAKEAKLPEEMMSGVRDLNPEYITTRYPDVAAGVPAEMYDEDIANKHYKTAEKVLNWVEKNLK